MGFCFFNNAAVAARWLRTVYGARPGQPLQRDVNGKEIKMERILILDWDVHHGASVPSPPREQLNVYISILSVFSTAAEWADLSVRNGLPQATALSARSKTTRTSCTSRCTGTATAFTRAGTMARSSRRDPDPVADCACLPPLLVKPGADASVDGPE